MTSDRPYRQAMTPAAACEQIADGAGTQGCRASARAQALLDVLAAG